MTTITPKGKKALALAGFIVALAGTLAYRAMTHEVPGDFARYYTAGGVIAAGEAERLYEEMSIIGRFEHSFRYLPTFAILMAPISELPLRGAYWVWQMLHYATYFTWLGCSYLAVRKHGASPWWMLLPALCTTRLCMQNFQLGQINPIVIALTLAGVYLWSRRRTFTAGALIGLGAALKFTPILFLGVFLAGRQWRATSGMLVSIVFFVVVMPSIVIGPALNVELIREYISLEGGLLTPHDEDRLEDGTRKPVAGQSLKALLNRYLTPTNAVHQSKHNDPIYVNFADVDPTIVHILYAIFSLALFLPLVAIAYRTRCAPPYAATIASATVICMLLLSPESRRAHFGILMLPFLLLTYEAIAPFVRRREMGLAAFLGLVSMLAIALPSRGLVGKPVANYVDAAGNMGLAALLLYAAVFMVHARVRRRERDEHADPGATATAVDAGSSPQIG